MDRDLESGGANEWWFSPSANELLVPVLHQNAGLA